MHRGTWHILVLACVAANAKHEAGHHPKSSTGTFRPSASRRGTLARQEDVKLTKQQRSKARRRRVMSRQLTWTGIDTVDGKEIDWAAIHTTTHDREVHADAPEKISSIRIRREVSHTRWFWAFAGVSIGVIVYGFLMCMCRSAGKQSNLEEESGLLQASISEGGLVVHGLVQVRPVFFGGAFFKQFSWCPEADVGRSLRIHDVQGKQVALAAGSLSPLVGDSGEGERNGEIALFVGPTLWAILCRTQDEDANPGRLQSFQVLTAQGSLYAEVKLLSDAKCIVEGPPPLKRRLMTVVGNFCHNDFLRGDRNIHVWIAQAGSERTLVGAQCETRTENLRSSGGSRRARSYFISTTEHADTPLVMAVMLGLQEVHTVSALSQPQYSIPEDAEDAAGEDRSEMPSAST